MARELSDDENEILRRFLKYGFYNANSAIWDVANLDFKAHVLKHQLRSKSMPNIAALEQISGLKLRIHFKRAFPRFEKIPPMDVNILSCAYKFDTYSLLGKSGHYSNRL